eukprot:CAMPEP_0182830242 /NCGR_PEP_ID=MMETSP0006_2-20121128/18468_1 /TAXON_ID=97485 /ORGANISM="Prymnesium parvum, Strain Texoma1" /LENGTH=99 /DNA_ID=CAMNT_0024957791 /DNA_START=255 /DNA_END=552 /DNA_ORIENTATION=+
MVIKPMQIMVILVPNFCVSSCSTFETWSSEDRTRMRKLEPPEHSNFFCDPLFCYTERAEMAIQASQVDVERWQSMLNCSVEAVEEVVVTAAAAEEEEVG